MTLDRFKRVGQYVLVGAWGLTVGLSPLALTAAIQQPSQPEGFSVSWEGLTAIGGLITALLAIMALVWRGGQLSNQLDNAQATAADALEELKATRQEFKSEVDGLTKKIDDLTRMVYELRGARGLRKGGHDDAG